MIGLNLASTMDQLNISVILLSTESHLAVGLKKNLQKCLGPSFLRISVP